MVALAEPEGHAEENVKQWIDRIERLKVKFALAMLLLVGILLHFTVVYVTEGGIHFFAFLEKTADAIIIAAFIGITYEWYASRSRHKLLQEEIREIINEEETELKQQVDEVKHTLEALADENTAAFNMIAPTQVEEELREKIEVCNQITCLGDFNIEEDGEDYLLDNIEEYTGNNLEKYIQKRVKNKDDEFQLFRIYPHEERDHDWIEDHKELFEHIESEASSDYQLIRHPHSVEYPLPCFMIIDDDNTPGGDMLVLAIPEKESMHDEFRHRILLYTEDQNIIDAFEDYFADIWDQSRVLNSADDLESARKEIAG